MANTCLIIESGKIMEYFQYKQSALLYISQHHLNSYSYEQSLQQIELQRQMNEISQETVQDIQKILSLENERNKKMSFASSIFNDKNDGQCHKITLSESDIKQDTTQFIQSLIFFLNHSGYVEINFDNRIQKVYFPISPYCECLTKDDIKSLVDNIDRTSQRTKQVDLMQKSEKIIASMKQEYKNRTKLKKLIIGDILCNLNIKTSKLRTISSYLSFVQNTIFLVSTSGDHSFYLQFVFLQTKSDSSVALQIIQIVCECLQIAIGLMVLGFYANKFIPLINIVNHLMFLKIGSKLDDKKKESLEQLIQKIFLQDIIFFVLVFLIFAVLGIFNFVFISLLLLDFFVRTPLLRNVFKSVWVPRKQLFYTMVLYILIQYLFAIVGYYTLFDEISSKEGIDLCDDLWQCFSMIVDMTFKSDGGFVGILNREESSYKGWGLNFRAIYDFIYAFFICLMMIQMLSGIIIDTFASLRGQQEQKNYDILNYCIICGQDRLISFQNRQSSDKNQQTRGFTHHCKYIHNIWHYIYFIAYIQDKQKTEYTGIESYVSSLVYSMDVQWFPNNSERIDADFEEKQEVKDQLNQLQQQISMLTQKINRLKK